MVAALWNSLPEQLREPDITFGQDDIVYVWLVGRVALCLNVKGTD